jgi:hypothetical protein
VTSEILKRFQGACHCGAIAFTFETSRSPDEWPIRACQCSFCRRHGARTTSDPSGRVSFEVRERSALLRYQFGLRTADFIVCRHCGVYLAAALTSDRGQFATLNVNALFEPLQFDMAAPVSYDEESPGERQSRREQRWTPVFPFLERTVD